MANNKHLLLLTKSVSTWNEWRKSNQGLRIDLIRASLAGANLEGADLRGVMLNSANLSGANLRGANLRGATLTKATLTGANFEAAVLREADLTGAKLNNGKFIGANLIGAKIENANLVAANLENANLKGTHLDNSNLSRANLRNATITNAQLKSTNLSLVDFSNANLRKVNLKGANLTQTILKNANLSEANLMHTRLIGTDLSQSNLSNCRIFAISAWHVNTEDTIQSNLIISESGEPEITVDNLEVAQFIYLMIHNEKLRDIIDTIGKKAVLILGRFTDERLAVLQAIREELREKNYIPILFDFDKPSGRDVTETVGLLAHMARFVIADITDAKSIPQELSHIIPDLPSVAVQPLIIKDQEEYGMFEHWRRYPWVLPVHYYESQEQLIAQLPEKVIQPAEAKVNELRPIPT